MFIKEEGWIIVTAKTLGYITDEELELDEIYSYVVKFFDENAKLNRYENRFGESNEIAIYFQYEGNERRLFCMSHKSRKFSKNGEKNRMINMDLDFWGNSVDIMKAIVTYFGGYIHENDCEEEGAYFIQADKKVQLKTEKIIKVTRSELNRRFGGKVVIIEDDEV